eukprot:TRINITY_DN395_c0_g1_i1.p1 TRINITY_DN395_c0_g1~~TRINITY_DN395_c0_g1_i1.p1  ORF type:complete len:170 (+),score=27.00 TRINITY_DN395_c0_g1_i1:440-949(+)
MSKFPPHPPDLEGGNPPQAKQGPLDGSARRNFRGQTITTPEPFALQSITTPFGLKPLWALARRVLLLVLNWGAMTFPFTSRMKQKQFNEGGNLEGRAKWRAQRGLELGSNPRSGMSPLVQLIGKSKKKNKKLSLFFKRKDLIFQIRAFQSSLKSEERSFSGEASLFETF